eukprot:jgi/Orpsp1_1/1185746/evm.model.c7180000095043.1
MYDDMEIPKNFEWTSRKVKYVKNKPPVSYLFKNLNVYYNYITFTDALFCITSFWVNDDLPLNVRNAIWEYNGWNKIIRKKLFSKGTEDAFIEKNGSIRLKETKFRIVFGIYLVQIKFKKWKSCPNLLVEYKEK